MGRVLGRTGTTTLLLGLAALLIGCETTRSARYAHYAGTRADAYLCCTMRFDRSHDASDANYDYRDAILLPAGTRVQILRMTPAKAEFVAGHADDIYRIQFRHGRDALRPGRYYGLLFTDDDPLARLPRDPRLRDAVHDGRLLVGMTKDEALMARGYPPAHRTPSLSDDHWLYYTDGRTCESVRFADGRIASIEQVAAPR